MDTLITFASTGDVLYNVFAWLSPINPGDINVASVDTFVNRWDSKSTTTPKTKGAVQEE